MEHRWDCYKDILQRQFLADDRKLEEVIEFMSETYNFRARY
jgi:hypothetical protein